MAATPKKPGTKRPSADRGKTRRQGFLVLGMHRSGTSSVAGTLARLGVTAPKTLLGANFGNERGHWESQVLNAFHDELLFSAGSRWDDWRPFRADWYDTPVAAEFKARAKQLLEQEFGETSAFVLKDPRIARFTRFWLDIFAEEGIEVKVLMPLRSPLEVAQSHRKRDTMPIRKGLLLWLRHVLDGEAASRHLPRAVFEWTTFLRDWRRVVADLEKILDIRWPALTDLSTVEVERFLTHDLKHESVPEADLIANPEVHAWVVSAYQALRELERDPASAGARAELDSLRARFDDAAVLFGGALADLEVSYVAQNAALRGEHEARLHAQEELRQARDAAAVAGEQALAAQHAVQAERDAKAAELDALAQSFEAFRASAAQMQAAQRDELNQVIESERQGRAAEAAAHAAAVARLEAERLAAQEVQLALRQELVERVQEAQAVQLALRQDMGDRLQEAQAHSRTLESQIATLRETQDATLAQHAAATADLADRLDRALHDLGQAERRGTEVQNDLARLLNSKSWRWTEPSRRVMLRIKNAEMDMANAALQLRRSGRASLGRLAGRVPPTLRRAVPAPLRDRLRNAIFPPRDGNGPSAPVGALPTAGSDAQPGVPEAAGASAPIPAKSGRVALLVSHDADRGGAPVVLASIASWLQKHTDYNVRIVCLRGGVSLAQFEAIAPTLVLGTMTIRDADVPHYRDIVSSFAGGDCAFVLVNSIASGDVLKLLDSSQKVFAFSHEMEKIISMFEPQFELICGRADKIFCASGAVRDAILARKPELAERVSVRQSFIDIPGDLAFLDAEAKRARRLKIGVPADVRLVVGCGTVHWRKQPEVFLRLARAVVSSRSDVHFVWIGDGEDLGAMRQQAQAFGAGRVSFVGHQNNVMDFLAAADVFTMTSLEDPFPLVCLEAAAASAPSVIFREAGGMVALVEPKGEEPGGIAVRLGDEAGFQNAVLALLDDTGLRERMARVAYERVRARYMARWACADILSRIQDVAGIAPRVSIIVPNYNCGPYLQERLDSIARQTFLDCEVLLLDDASTDGSLAILEAAAKDRRNWSCHPAETNSGTPFRAWRRGIELARGDLIWIAEADDFCEPDFLERAVAAFDIAGTRLAHGRSIPVSTQGTIAGDYNDFYLNRVASGHWTASHHAPAARAVAIGLGRANVIPNASGVVVTRDAALKAIRTAVDFRLAGDWAFYLVAVHGGLVAYVHDAVNYHRRHETTVTRSVEGSTAYFQEFADVHTVVRHLYGDHQERDDAALAFLRDEAQRFGFSGVLPEGRLPAALSGPRPLNVLYGVGDLSGGGAQMFALRFAAGLPHHGSGSVLFTCDNEPDNPAVVAQLSRHVPRVSALEISAAGFGEFCKEWGIDLVVTGHWWADRAVAAWKEAATDGCPWIVVMHGCHENVLAHRQDFPDFADVMQAMEKHVSHWVWTADKNRAIFEQGFVSPQSISHITNGFKLERMPDSARCDFGLRDDSVVFVLASRAVEAKGWFAAVKAFEIVRARLKGKQSAELVLVGDGPAMDDLQGRRLPDGVKLLRHTSRLENVIAVSDVCLLPSWFSGESLPLTVIEFLAQGKPAIVSDIGMCPWAIDDGPDAAGIVVPRSAGGKVEPSDLAEAMLKMVLHPDFRAASSRNAKTAFAKFDFDRMMQRYLSVARVLVRPERDDDAAGAMALAQA